MLVVNHGGRQHFLRQLEELDREVTGDDRRVLDEIRDFVEQRGVVTGLTMFFRSAGSAVGVAVFGAIVNATLGGAELESDRVAPAALTTAVHSVFLGTTVLAVAMLAAVLVMPRDRGRGPAPARDGTDVAAG